VTGPGPGEQGRADAPQVAVGAVAVHDGHLLLVRRGTAPEAGRWSIPGGRVGAGESLAAAVEREVREETGLAVRCGSLVGVAERMGPGHHFVILDFAVELPGSEGALPPPVAGDDAAECAWTGLDAVEGMDLVEGLAGFLRRHGVLGPDTRSG